MLPNWSFHLLALTGFLVASSLAVAGEPAKVVVRLSDGSNGRMSLKLSPSKVPSGPVEFTIKNESRDMEHEFLFAPWSGPDSALPYDGKTQQVKEDKVNGLQGVEDLRPRQTVAARFTLTEGRYVLFCNEPGHYHDDMRANLIVGAAK
ncbi:cupredoxin domain-containing protein [Trinickia symbiotica]|uniref:Blue (type 1) copper domain-containing protein n=1 Tax=Trinickia symbiotica TaxID=863227 RepID=A0A2N7X4J7_9BURK|nr:hypothetical protein [Trinickia symbiotica]PMS36683.1 hypothetical protein C0Z20_11340 [Trinickia symbiotica]